MRRGGRVWLTLICSGLVLAGSYTNSSAVEPNAAARDNFLAQAAEAGEIDRVASMLDAEERELRDEYERGRQELHDLAERVIVEGRAYVRVSRAGMLVLSLGLEQFLGRASRLERLKRSLGRDLRRQQELTQRVSELGQKLLTLRQQRAPLSAAQLARLKERSALADAKERASAFERAFASVDDHHTAVYAAQVPFGGPARDADHFTAMRGRLPFPVAGRTEILLAKRRGGGGPGLELRAPAGTKVQAVFAGRVVFADRYADYGETVIVDHGEGYFTVSAGLESPRVRVGQEVSVGTTLGEVFEQERGTALYFEIRFLGEPVNPAEWFGI
ncbi:MAG TPA: peptidoglycan DD-metalloendopeptidase family protein [Polyangiaceae bacterium]|nr:peptidoglycan DD-metalloendopeptidase family protein [Polyangiaceae bacterium]